MFPSVGKCYLGITNAHKGLVRLTSLVSVWSHVKLYIVPLIKPRALWIEGIGIAALVSLVRRYRFTDRQVSRLKRSRCCFLKFLCVLVLLAC